ncbi:MAG: hypothetical protein AAF645_06115, partial [Myxococcota bacterium]
MFVRRMFVHRIALALTFLVVAAGARADDEPVLHEYIPEASDGDLDFVLGSDNLPSVGTGDGSSVVGRGVGRPVVGVGVGPGVGSVVG